MEYVCLILQIILMLGIFIFKTNDIYLVNSNEFYKKYLIVELITQAMCVVANVIILFVIKEIMIYILALHIILMGIILTFYSNKAKKVYFDKLTKIIIENKLQLVDYIEIKKYLLEKYGEVHFVENIKKCINRINNN